MCLNIFIPAFVASSLASGSIFTLNASITPYSSISFFVIAASRTSRFVTGPTSAILTGIPLFFNVITRASNVPRVSAFTTTPLVSVLIFNDSTSSLTFFTYSSRRDLSGTTRRGAPATTPSKSGAAIFTPAAAETSSTLINLPSWARISWSGRGIKRALTFVTIGFSNPPTTIISPFLSIPSYIITSIVVPRPGSSFTSSTTPLAGPLVIISLFAIYCCIKPASTARSSGIPSPVFAETGTIATVFVKSLILSNLSAWNPRRYNSPTIRYILSSSSCCTSGSCFRMEKRKGWLG